MRARRATPAPPSASSERVSLCAAVTDGVGRHCHAKDDQVCLAEASSSSDWACLDRNLQSETAGSLEHNISSNVCTVWTGYQRRTPYSAAPLARRAPVLATCATLLMHSRSQLAPTPPGRALLSARPQQPGGISPQKWPWQPAGGACPLAAPAAREAVTWSGAGQVQVHRQLVDQTSSQPAGGIAAQPSSQPPQQPDARRQMPAASGPASRLRSQPPAQPAAGPPVSSAWTPSARWACAPTAPPPPAAPRPGSRAAPARRWRHQRSRLQSP
jgi:hypothetical protein